MHIQEQHQSQSETF